MLKFSLHCAYCVRCYFVISSFFRFFIKAYYCYLLVYLVPFFTPLAPPFPFATSKDLCESKPVADVRSHEFRLLVTKRKHDEEADENPSVRFFFLFFVDEIISEGSQSATYRVVAAIKVGIFIKAALSSPRVELCSLHALTYFTPMFTRAEIP